MSRNSCAANSELGVNIRGQEVTAICMIFAVNNQRTFNSAYTLLPSDLAPWIEYLAHRTAHFHHIPHSSLLTPHISRLIPLPHTSHLTAPPRTTHLAPHASDLQSSHLRPQMPHLTYQNPHLTSDALHLSSAYETSYIPCHAGNLGPKGRRGGDAT